MFSHAQKKKKLIDHALKIFFLFYCVASVSLDWYCIFTFMQHEKKMDGLGDLIGIV